jgi:hypothetical protein
MAMQISAEAAVEALWLAVEWEPIDPAEIFDRIVARLHRNPRFRDLPVAAPDLAVADSRRELEHDIADFEWRLVRAFKDAIGFDGTDGVAA